MGIAGSGGGVHGRLPPRPGWHTVIRHPDNVYQDPGLPGSLVAALRAWQALVLRGDQIDLRQLAFTYSCPSITVAHEVSALLHQRPTCETTMLSRVGVGSGQVWQVRGTTCHQVQSLVNLERLFTWLRTVGQTHRASLTVLSLR